MPNHYDCIWAGDYGATACATQSYNDPVYGYQAVGIYNGNPDMNGDGDAWSDNNTPEIYEAFGHTAVSNYNQYCYNDAVSCFGSCSGPMGQACNQACRFKLRDCCNKQGSYSTNPDAGSICGNTVGDNYIECNCHSKYLENIVSPPKGMKYKPPQLYSTPGNSGIIKQTRNTVGGTAPNKLKKDMRIKRKCSSGEMRLPNGNCVANTIRVSDDSVMAQGYCCGQSHCDSFQVRVQCEDVETTCENPSGCGSYNYGDNFITNQFNFEPLSGGGFGCTGGCSLSGGTLEYSCLGTTSAEINQGYSSNDSICGQTTSCNCVCTDNCNETILTDAPPKMF